MFTQRVCQLTNPIVRGLDFLAPVADLGLRLWVGIVFLKSGLAKIQSMESTIMLFENEFQVPLLSATVAAYLGTFVELVFPVLLIIGLGGRFAALVLFLFNIVAVISYPGLNPHRGRGPLRRRGRGRG